MSKIRTNLWRVGRRKYIYLRLNMCMESLMMENNRSKLKGNKFQKIKLKNLHFYLKMKLSQRVS